MQANFLIDKQLGQNLIDFFAQAWLENYPSYYPQYSSEKAAQAILEHVQSSMVHGWDTSWTLGGTSNNCWGDSSSVSMESEPELPSLDEFFMAFYPLISFMQYKFISKAITRDTYADSDYYGGSTHHASKKLGFDDLSKAMIKAKVLVEPNVVRLEELTTYISDTYSAEKLAQQFKPVEPRQKKKQKNT